MKRVTMRGYIYKTVDYYSMKHLSRVIDEFKREYYVIGYEAFAQEQRAVLVLYPKER